MADLYKGIEGSPITYLAADISASQTTISVADDSALPDAPNICTIGYGENLETIKYETKSNGVLQNVTRGVEGTPRAWQAGTEVARFFTAYDHNAIIENFNSHLADYTTLNEEWENAKDRSLLQYSSLQEIKRFAPESYMGRYHAIQISGESDMNDVIYSGLYYVVANDTRNTPTNVNGYLLVISAHAGHCVQMYMTTSRTNYNIYLRKYISGSGWGDWGTNS